MTIAEHRTARWETRFGSFVRSYGVARLAQQLQLDTTAIRQWVRGHTSPRPPHARAIVVLSENTLTLDDIYAQKDLHADQD